MQEELRKVKFGAHYNGSDLKYNSEADGLFHRWADDTFYSDEKYHKRLVAIIEATNGEVFIVPPDYLKFVHEKAPKPFNFEN